MEWRGGMCPGGTGYPCRCGALRGGAGGGRPLTLPLAFLLPPIPPPPLAERSSPAGKGENQSLFRRGLRPRHPCIKPFAAPTATAKRVPRGQNPRGTGYPCHCGALRGGAGGGRLLTLPLACFSAPYPPAPLPRRGRGRIKVYFAGGFAPGTPALDRSRHLQPLPSGYPGGRTRAALAIPAAVENAMGACPARHLLSLPRGRGPSQTPKFLSPGPPSPWLPALPIERRF